MRTFGAIGLLGGVVAELAGDHGALLIAALALIVWSLLDPRPIPVILAMSVAQGLGTLSFAAFLVVVVRDLRTAQRKEHEALTRE